MFGMRWRIVRLLGIPVYIDASWLIILALMTLSLAQAFPVLLQDYFPAVAPATAAFIYWIMAVVAAVAFFGCILLHELGHAIVARTHGAPIRGITLFLFGGVAEIGEEPASAGNEFLMAVAGPAVSLLLALFLGGLALAGRVVGWPPPVILVLAYLGFFNLAVLVFNLIPAFPLDGGRVLRSILWGVTGNLRKATYWCARIGQVFAFLLMAFGVLQIFRGYMWDGIWLGLIGMFLNNAARSGYEQVLIRQALQGEPIRQFMTTDPIAVPPSLDLRHWVEDYVYRYHHKAFPVVEGGHLEGLIDTRDLAAIPRAEWERHTVREVMRHDLEGLTVSPDTDALQALTRIRRAPAARLLVTEGGRLVGILGVKDLMHFLNVRLELEGGSGHAPGGNGQEQNAIRK
jgi:Zn-dependent protease/CBS domain-containing protein